MVLFTGSDWCPWCRKLEQEVLKKKEFQDWVKENAVFYTADFPRTAPQEKKLAEENQILVEKYGIEGFPTIVLIDAEGKAFARTGYRPGGPEPYVRHLESLIKNR